MRFCVPNGFFLVCAHVQRMATNQSSRTRRATSPQQQQSDKCCESDFTPTPSRSISTLSEHLTISATTSNVSWKTSTLVVQLTKMPATILAMMSLNLLKHHPAKISLKVQVMTTTMKWNLLRWGKRKRRTRERRRKTQTRHAKEEGMVDPKR